MRGLLGEIFTKHSNKTRLPLRWPLFSFASDPIPHPLNRRHIPIAHSPHSQQRRPRLPRRPNLTTSDRAASPSLRHSHSPLPLSSPHLLPLRHPPSCSDSRCRSLPSPPISPIIHNHPSPFDAAPSSSPLYSIAPPSSLLFTSCLLSFPRKNQVHINCLMECLNQRLKS